VDQSVVTVTATAAAAAARITDRNK